MGEELEKSSSVFLSFFLTFFLFSFFLSRCLSVCLFVFLSVSIACRLTKELRLFVFVFFPRVATGSHKIASQEHLHAETKVAPVSDHLQLLSVQFLASASRQEHVTIISQSAKEHPPLLMLLLQQLLQLVQFVRLSVRPASWLYNCTT